MFLPLVVVGLPVKAATLFDSPKGLANPVPPAAYSDAFHLGNRTLLLSTLTICAALLGSGCKAKTSNSVSSSFSLAASPNATPRLKGTTAAVEARSIQAPLLAGQQVSTLTITKLISSGSRVKKGDLLVEFDRQAQLRDSIDRQAESATQNENVLEAKAKEEAAVAKDETEIKQAESALSKAKLEMEKVELLSRIDAEKAREDLDEAEATLTQLKATFDLKRKAAQASIRILEIQRDRTRETMLHSLANATLMQIHSPIDGLVVFNTIWKQGHMGEVQEGDQVRPGVPFLQVIDPSRMEVRAPVNQEDLVRLNVGQTVAMHLDAYPDLTFHGRLESIDPLGQKGDFSPQLRTYSAVFSIQGNDPRLMPDLSAAVDLTGENSSGSASQ
jgi:multidrug resistance efflux pump